MQMKYFFTVRIETTILNYIQENSNFISYYQHVKFLKKYYYYLLINPIDQKLLLRNQFQKFSAQRHIYFQNFYLFLHQLDQKLLLQHFYFFTEYQIAHFKVDLNHFMNKAIIVFYFFTSQHLEFFKCLFFHALYLYFIQIFFLNFKFIKFDSYFLNNFLLNLHLPPILRIQIFP